MPTHAFPSASELGQFASRCTDPGRSTPGSTVLSDGGVKLFGLAEEVAIASGLDSTADEPLDATRTGAIRGTPASMSPEQVRGQRAGRRSDVFAFGALAYEMLAGWRASSRPAWPRAGGEQHGLVDRGARARRDHSPEVDLVLAIGMASRAGDGDPPGCRLVELDPWVGWWLAGKRAGSDRRDHAGSGMLGARH